MIPLPVDAHLPAISEALISARAVVVTAAPGAGKTSRVPPALLAAGPLVLLQPRRVAARAIAQRIADERHWTVGREVGWQVRLDVRKGPDTRLLVVTEGILTAFLQSDPLLSSFNTIVLDEFHERSIHADLAIALAREAWQARKDLRLVVMSATLDAGAVARYLGDCPIIEVPGSLHPVDIEYAGSLSVSDAAVQALNKTGGDILCFLPGAFEIARAIGDLRTRVPDSIEVVPLHGALEFADQQAALRPSRGRRVVVATNIAETSITVPGVTGVVDAGLQKVARYDAARGIDSLETERITQDAADQRAGRAGRLSAGFVCRLWESTLRLRPHREPDISRIDLAGPCLDILAWGASPLAFKWFERPHEEALDGAMALLRRLGAVDGDRLTSLGARMHRLPVHPRLARMLIESDGSQAIIRACALLSERHFLPLSRASSNSDLLSAVDAWHDVAPHIKRVASDIESRSSGASGGTTKAKTLDEADFLRAVLAGYPDRVAQRREPGSARLKLASGAGATLSPESAVRAGEFMVAIDARRREVRGNRADKTADDETVVRMASVVEREWLVANRRETVHRYDESTRSVRASVIESFDALTLRETPVPPDPAIGASLLAEAWMRRPSPADIRLLRRMRFAGVALDAEAAMRTAAYGVHRLDDVDFRVALSAEQVRAIDRDAPERLTLPSGRSTGIEYGDDGTIGASAKLQELFGLAETPRIGPSKTPLVLTLLAPNGRPVQVTQDLKSFWNRTYPEVRKELRGRYPKHPWPDDPWTATPTAKTNRRSGPTRG